MLTSKNKHSGFTLVEVLVALFIIGIGMAAAISIFTSTTVNTSYLHDKSFSYWVAQNQLAEIEALNSPPPIGTATGDEKLADTTWYWTRKVEKTEDPDTNRIELTVRKEKNKKAQNYATLITLIHSPS